ncbi:hypothetical protein NBRC116494_11290 [Aurantivibrio plasticivorans]
MSSIRRIFRPDIAIVLSIATFIALVLSILLLNMHTARQIDESSLAINLAGRQRMLTQRMEYLLLAMDSQKQGGDQRVTLLSELDRAIYLFDSTLTALHSGGEVVDSAGAPAYLRAREAERVRELLRNGLSEWAVYRRHIDEVLNGQRAASGDYSNFEILYTLMNQVTTGIDLGAREQAATLRRYQAVAVVIVLAHFLLILWQIRSRYRSLTHNNRMLRRLINSVGSAILVFDERDRVSYTNKAAEELFRAKAGALRNLTLDELVIEHTAEPRAVRTDGTQFVARYEMVNLNFSGDVVKVLSISDLTEYQRSKEKWRHIAHHDILTGLSNRLAFEQRAHEAFSEASRYKEKVAVLTIDLNGFKSVNDRYGHAVGDRLLKEIASQFRVCVRAEDLVARLGGDEFLVLLTRLPRDEEASHKVAQVCAHLLRAAQVPVDTPDGPVSISASIGVSYYPDDGNGLGDVQRSSDAAMYRAKKQGVGCELAPDVSKH